MKKSVSILLSYKSCQSKRVLALSGNGLKHLSGSSLERFELKISILSKRNLKMDQYPGVCCHAASGSPKGRLSYYPPPHRSTRLYQTRHASIGVDHRSFIRFSSRWLPVQMATPPVKVPYCTLLTNTQTKWQQNLWL